MEIGEMWSIPPLSLLPGPLYPRVVVPVRVQPVVQIDLLETYSCLVGIRVVT